MTIVLRFSSSSGANGMEALAFQRSSQGLGIFYNFMQQAVVANDQVAFPSMSPPGDFAFRLDSPSGTRWRSGPQILSGQTTDTFHIVNAGSLTFTPADVTKWLPTPPITSGDVTILTIGVTLGTGSLTATGSARYATFLGSIPVTYAYVFTLIPVTEPANMGFPNGVPPAVEVRTISLTVTGAAGGFLGFLVNAFVNVLASMISGSLAANIQTQVQRTIDAAVAAALAARSAPAGTIATVETLSVAPDGITLATFAGFSLERACAATPSGGSLTIRSPEQLAHLRLIRDRLLRRSPQGLAYIELFEKFSPELVRMLIDDEELLRLADVIVRQVTEEFPRQDTGAGRLSKETARLVLTAMEQVERRASPDLALTVRALREEVSRFVGRPAREVIEESLRLIED